MCKASAGEFELEMEIEDSLCVGELPTGTQVILHTANRDYFMVTCGGAKILLQGHPDHCPDPARLYLMGAKQRASAPQPGTIRRGMRVEFWDPVRGIVLMTSRVRGFRMLPVQAGR